MEVVSYFNFMWPLTSQVFSSFEPKLFDAYILDGGAGE